tara:strand:+ start:4408 stop:4548 length:141 start_codon:yes stop_codon:yes gene_type:complete
MKDKTPSKKKPERNMTLEMLTNIKILEQIINVMQSDIKRIKSRLGL